MKLGGHEFIFEDGQWIIGSSHPHNISEKTAHEPETGVFLNRAHHILPPLTGGTQEQVGVGLREHSQLQKQYLKVLEENNLLRYENNYCMHVNTNIGLAGTR